MRAALSGHMENKNDRNTHEDARTLSFDEFKARYFEGHPVEDRIARPFWSDFRFAFEGSLLSYIEATTRSEE